MGGGPLSQTLAGYHVMILLIYYNLAFESPKVEIIKLTESCESFIDSVAQ